MASPNAPAPGITKAQFLDTLYFVTAQDRNAVPGMIADDVGRNVPMHEYRTLEFWLDRIITAHLDKESETYAVHALSCNEYRIQHSTTRKES